MNGPVGVFDSGVGGLSIVQELKRQLPNENIIYVADQAHLPYGAKSQGELEELVFKIGEFLIEKKAKVIVIACNTATVHTIDFLRASFNVPIIGTVPVVKTLSEKTKTDSVAILSTPATAKSDYLKQLIKKFLSGKKVYIIGDTKLEHIVESGELDTPEIYSTLSNIIEPLVEKNVDSVALGCTHYSFLKKQIEKVASGRLMVYDSAAAVARQTKKILEENKATSSKKEFEHFYTTADAQKFDLVASHLGFETPRAKNVKI